MSTKTVPFRTYKAALCILFCCAPAFAVTSDDSNPSVLNPGLWTYVDPVGDGSVLVNGRQVLILVPSGSVLLVARFSEVSFGQIEIVPIAN